MGHLRLFREISGIGHIYWVSACSLCFWVQEGHEPGTSAGQNQDGALQELFPQRRNFLTWPSLLTQNGIHYDGGKRRNMEEGIMYPTTGITSGMLWQSISRSQNEKDPGSRGGEIQSAGALSAARKLDIMVSLNPQGLRSHGHRGQPGRPAVSAFEN